MNPHFTRFAIFLNQIPSAQTSREVISRHIEHLRKLDQQGKLVMCGPFTDFPGGLVVVLARDAQEARAIAEADPFVAEGVRHYEVRTWLIACAENNYLA